jgi:hypothetical protein
MRSFGFVFVLLFQLFATQATAGAWLKSKGSGFTSVSFSMSWFRDTGQTSYLEFGARDDLTVGLDTGLLQSPLGETSGFALAFARRPIGPDEGPHRFAYEIGVGAAWVDGMTSPLLKTGLSWGRGLSLGDRNGWASVDAAVVWDLGQGTHQGKLDATLGMPITNRFTFATIAPSVVVSPWKGDGKFRIQIGAETEVGNPENTAIKIGLWREF